MVQHGSQYIYRTILCREPYVNNRFTALGRNGGCPALNCCKQNNNPKNIEEGRTLKQGVKGRCHFDKGRRAAKFEIRTLTLFRTTYRKFIIVWKALSNQDVAIDVEILWSQTHFSSPLNIRVLLLWLKKIACILLLWAVSKFNIYINWVGLVDDSVKDWEFAYAQANYQSQQFWDFDLQATFTTFSSSTVPSSRVQCKATRVSCSKTH